MPAAPRQGASVIGLQHMLRQGQCATAGAGLEVHRLGSLPAPAPDAVTLEAVTATGDRPAERWRRPVGNAAGRTFEVAVPTGDPWHDRGRPAKAHLPLTLARAVDAQEAAAGGALRRCIGFTGARFGRVESHGRTGAQVYGHNTAVDGLARDWQDGPVDSRGARRTGHGQALSDPPSCW